MEHFVKLWNDQHGSCAEDIPKIILQLKEHFHEELLKYPIFDKDIRRDMETKAYTKVVKGRIPTLTIRNKSPSTSTLRKPEPKNSVFYPVDEKEKENRAGHDPPSIAEAKSIVKDKIIELIRNQRLAYMIQGQSFRKHRSEGFIFCQLSKNQKYLYYWDMAKCKDNTKEAILETQDKIAIENIVRVQTTATMITELCSNGPGSDAHIGLSGLHDLMKIKKYIFSIDYEHDVLRKIPRDQLKLEFIARDRKAFDYFDDGLNILMKRKMDSDKFFEDFKELEKMESRMTFIQANKGDVTKTLPKMPPPPSNYNFCQHHYSNGKVFPLATQS